MSPRQAFARLTWAEAIGRVQEIAQELEEAGVWDLADKLPDEFAEAACRGIRAAGKAAAEAAVVED